MPAAAPFAARPRRRLADDLRAAIDAGEIELRFQPQVLMATGAVTGVEVLARWRHARLGELGAEQLFAAAARAALLPALSAHIHAASLAEVGGWPRSLGGLTVALNVTAPDLARPAFAPTLLAQAAACGVAAARLTLEVTEHEPIADLSAAALVLAALREAGARVAVDDFGSGYSSIAYLRTLPLDYVKLDAELSGDLLLPEPAPRVVRQVIAMARALGLDVIAEGVEDADHHALLAAAGATHYQGFLCAPPLDTTGLIRLMERQ